MSLSLEHQRHCGHFDFLWTAADQIRSSYHLQMSSNWNKYCSGCILETAIIRTDDLGSTFEASR